MTADMARATAEQARGTAEGPLWDAAAATWEAAELKEATKTGQWTAAAAATTAKAAGAVAAALKGTVDGTMAESEQVASWALATVEWSSAEVELVEAASLQAKLEEETLSSQTFLVSSIFIAVV